MTFKIDVSSHKQRLMPVVAW